MTEQWRGPFLGCRPSAATTVADWRWYWEYFDPWTGRVLAIEWGP